MQKRIGVLIYRDVQALDVAGPMDAFADATVSAADGSGVPVYEVFTVAASRRALRSESGLTLRPNHTFETCPDMDTLVIPGGSAMRDPRVTERLAPWIAQQAKRARRVAAICTGTFGLAATGLLRNRRVTTHWRYARDLAARYPELQVDANALFIQDGRFYTSAGITAGIDLALALIEEDAGRAVSLQVARDLVVYLRRAGDQAQYSEPLEFEAKSLDRLSDIARWITTNIHRKITMEALGRRASLCPRQVSRRFKSAFGTTPAAFIESVRLKEAQRRLAATEASIKRVAVSLGYRSAHVFRRAFERRFGISPGAYRERFGSAG
jgi:transcriptional regulator GlxA family with amidase domain